MIKQIPNILTLLNLITGVLGIINVFQGDYTNTIFFIFIAGVFDFLDGFAARLLQVAGPMGKELDSLADVVSFGVLPSLYLFQLSSGLGNPLWVNSLALLIAAFSAYRLARFNIDTNQSDRFIGLPTPANAIMVTTIAQLPIHLIPSQPLIIGLATVSSLLLISPFEMIALKFKNFKFQPNVFRYLLMIVLIILIAWLGWGSLPFMIPIYIFFSFISFVAGRSAKNNVENN
jgi:CDP-diacylglycerol--serine O-phosphatidyltransferase